MDVALPKRSRLYSSLWSLCCLAGSMYSVYLLYLDYVTPSGVRFGKPMAKIEQREFSVRRRQPDSFLWSHVRAGDPLFLRDSLLVGPSSAAVVAMDNGARLEVGENSLLVFDDFQDMALNFSKGSFVIRGLTGDQKVQVGENGNVKATKLSFRLMSPSSAGKLFLTRGEKLSVNFSWSPLNQEALKAHFPVLEVSSRKSFTTVTTSILIQDLKINEKVIPLGEGNYYWRIVANNESLTEVRTFSIVKTPSLNPVWPNATEELFQVGANDSVQFRWAVAGDPNKFSRLEGVEHLIQVSTDSGFKRVIRFYAIDLSSGKAQVSSLEPGKYFWRIMSRYPGEKVISPVERIEIRAKNRIEVKLLSPPLQEAVRENATVRFRWDSEGSRLDYVWQVEPLFPSGGSLKKSVLTTAKYVDSELSASGKYHWRVSAYQGDQVIGESPWRDVVVFDGEPLELTGPANGEEIYYWDQPTPFELKWRSDSIPENSGEYYEVVLSQNKMLSNNSVLKKSTEPHISSSEFGIGPGFYFWKVRQLDSEGILVKESPVFRFRYGIYPKLSAPKGISPVSGALLKLHELPGNPRLEWSPIGKATGYEYFLLQNGVIKKQGKTQLNSVEFSSLQPGKYFWTVRAIDSKGRGGESMTQSFIVEYGGQLEAPEDTDWEIKH